MLDPGQLKVLKEVADRGSFSAAADSLGYTQSAISKQIAALERDAGVSLVERAVRPVRVTEAGRTLLAHAEAAFGHFAAAQRELDEIAGLRAGTLRLGTFASAGAPVVVPAISAFHSRYPGVTLSLIEGEPPELISLVRSGDLDLAVVYDYPAVPGSIADEQLEVTPLLTDNFELIVPSDHALARRRRLRLASLSGEQWLFPRITGGVSSTYDRLMRGACAVAGFEPQVLFEINDCQTAQGFVAAGLGIAVLPQLALYPLHDGVTLRSLQDAPSRQVAAVRLRGAVPTPSASAALELLRVAGREAQAI